MVFLVRAVVRTDEAVHRKLLAQSLPHRKTVMLAAVFFFTGGFISPFRGVKSGPERLTDLPKATQLEDGGKTATHLVCLSLACLPVLKASRSPGPTWAPRTLQMLPGTRSLFPEGYLELRSLQGTPKGSKRLRYLWSLRYSFKETLGGSPALGLAPRGAEGP